MYKLRKCPREVMVDPKTIDNLGIEHSNRWAQDQKIFDQSKSIIQEAPFVSKQTSTDVAIPFFESEFDVLFQSKKHFIPWALLSEPKGYTLQKMRLFTYQFIPSLGGEEFLSSQIEKIQNKKNANKQARIERHKQGMEPEFPWQDKKEDEDEEKESKTLIALLEYINSLDLLIAQINARRSQFSKG